MTTNRRRSERVPVGFYVDQIVGDAPHRCFTTDLSSIGLYMERLAAGMQRPTSIVQMEIQLPRTSDSIWACGEVVYDRLDSLFHGTAVRFTGMARKHQRLIREWLREARRADRFQDLPLRHHPSPVRVHRPGAALPAFA
ncbi:MAG: PilZ domain-containing protein [Myxococcales bacterium]|nr:PilZ domain-containing protein [Myxococcales bacterium]